MRAAAVAIIFIGLRRRQGSFVNIVNRGGTPAILSAWR